MSKDTRFQRYREWFCNRAQRLRGGLARLRTKSMAWGRRFLRPFRAVWCGAMVVLVLVIALGIWLLRGIGWLLRAVGQMVGWGLTIRKATWNGIWKARDHLRRHPSLLVGIIVLVLFIPFIWSLWQLPEWQVAGAQLTDAKRIELMDKARGTIAQIWAGIVVLFGLGFTWRRIEIAREGQITERFTRAIDQLGSTETLIWKERSYAMSTVLPENNSHQHTSIRTSVSLTIPPHHN